MDCYAKIESSRLDFFRHQQRQLRVELYSGLADALLHDAAGDNAALARMLGRRVILPATHVGSPRYMHQLYQDAMAIVTTHGKPDLFITVTCNPKWPEIREALFDNGQRSPDRPDLIVRVFSEKLKAIMDDITKEGVLGRVRAWMYVIEFQKRGLPHAHIVVILENGLKPRTAQDLDNIVSAELPDVDRYSKARPTVAKEDERM